MLMVRIMGPGWGAKRETVVRQSPANAAGGYGVDRRRRMRIRMRMMMLMMRMRANMMQ